MTQREEEWRKWKDGTVKALREAADEVEQLMVPGERGRMQFLALIELDGIPQIAHHIWRTPMDQIAKALDVILNQYGEFGTDPESINGAWPTVESPPKQ